MSAWIVSKRHIDYMLTAGLKFDSYPLGWMAPVEEKPAEVHERGEPWGPEAVAHARERRQELTGESAGRVGVMLWAENYESVNHRYDEREVEAELYEYKPYPGGVDPVQVLKAIDCFEYQSCEPPGWEASEARAFCEALRQRTIGKLPGYEEAKWAIG